MPHVDSMCFPTDVAAPDSLKQAPRVPKEAQQDRYRARPSLSLFRSPWSYAIRCIYEVTATTASSSTCSPALLPYLESVAQQPRYSTHRTSKGASTWTLQAPRSRPLQFQSEPLLLSPSWTVPHHQLRLGVTMTGLKDHIPMRSVL